MQSLGRIVPTLAITITLITWPGPINADDYEREGLIIALKELQARLLLLKDRATTDHLEDYWELAVRNERYLEYKAHFWKPTRTDDGKQLREAIQRLSNTLREVLRGSVAKHSEVLYAAFEDLAQKARYCRSGGLTAEPTVIIWTKHRGREEVKGLEVWFLEKFVAIVNPTAPPHRFSQFSSPVKTKLPAGSYWFWATDPSTGKAGPKAEGCACDYNPGQLAQALFKFEILSP